MINIVIFSGATPANSKNNIMLWMDNLVLRYSNADTLVKDCGGNRLQGCYHHLKQDHAFVNRGRTWHQQCTSNNISRRSWNGPMHFCKQKAWPIHKPIRNIERENKSKKKMCVQCNVCYNFSVEQRKFYSMCCLQNYMSSIVEISRLNFQ